MRCMYCGKSITEDEAVFRDEDTPLCYNCSANFGTSLSSGSGEPRCANCKVTLQLISERNQIMTFKVSSLLMKGKGGGGPLRFKLYECPSCGEYRFFKNS
ncbi:MAG: hypothetical protein IKH78_05415 [Ruminococcus sp.]|nr:hypothetical protein [Ruminococcus sp.]